MKNWQANNLKVLKLFWNSSYKSLKIRNKSGVKLLEIPLGYSLKKIYIWLLKQTLSGKCFVLWNVKWICITSVSFRYILIIGLFCLNILILATVMELLYLEHFSWKMKFSRVIYLVQSLLHLQQSEGPLYKYKWS